MSPIGFLTICIAITLVAIGVYVVADMRRRHRLRELAGKLEMHFSPGDRFKQAAIVAQRFPAVGAADPSISDVLYCRRDECYCYVFRFDYTIGVTGPKLRRRAIVGFTESCGNGEGKPSPLLIATPGCNVVEQYQELISKLRSSSKEAEAVMAGT